MSTTPPANIDAYIATFPEVIQHRLQQLRETISKAAPEAQEIISYGMPAYRMGGILVYFAAHKNHIGFYPYSSAIVAFQKELSAYKGAKGSVQFPHDQPIPYDLIRKIIAFRAEENKEKLLQKKKK
jgi:uncharacterized protein YdhG (YjbR/CyaY superfamily)